MVEQKAGRMVEWVKGVGNWLLPGDTRMATNIPGEEDPTLFSVDTAEEHIHSIKLSGMSEFDNNSEKNAKILLEAERALVKNVIQDRVKALSRIGEKGPLFFDCYFIVSDEIFQKISESDGDYGSGETAVIEQEIAKMFKEQLSNRDVQVHVQLISNKMLGMNFGRTYPLEPGNFVFIAPPHLTITEGRTDLPQVIGRCRLVNHRSGFEHEAPIFQNQPKFRIGNKWYDNIHEPSLPLPLNMRLTPDGRSIFVAEILEPLAHLVGQSVQKDPVNGLVYRVERPDERSYTLLLYDEIPGGEADSADEVELDGVRYGPAFSITLELFEKQVAVSGKRKAPPEQKERKAPEIVPEPPVEKPQEPEPSKAGHLESGFIFEPGPGSASILIREPEQQGEESRNLIFTHRMLPYPNPKDPNEPYSSYGLYMGSQGDVVTRKEDAVLEFMVDEKNLAISALVDNVQYSDWDGKTRVLKANNSIVVPQPELKKYAGKIQFRKDSFELTVGESSPELSTIRGFFAILDTEPDHTYSLGRDDGLLVIGRSAHAMIHMPSGEEHGKEYQKTGVSRLHGLYDSENSILYNISGNFPIYLVRDGELISLDPYPVNLSDVKSDTRLGLYRLLHDRLLENEPDGVRLHDGDRIIIGGMVFRYEDTTERKERASEPEQKLKYEPENVIVDGKAGPDTEEKSTKEEVPPISESPADGTKEQAPVVTGNEMLVVVAGEQEIPPVDVAPYLLKFVGWWLRNPETEAQWNIGFTKGEELIIPKRRGENLGPNPPRMPVSWLKPELKIPDLQIVLTRDEEPAVVPFGVGFRVRFESEETDHRMDTFLKIGKSNILAIPGGGMIGVELSSDGKLILGSLTGVDPESIRYGLTGLQTGIQWVDYRTLKKEGFNVGTNDFVFVERKIYQLCKR